MSRVILLLTLAGFCLSSPLQGELLARPADPFDDVPSHHWAYRSVERLRRAGILEGWGTRFHGRRSFTRYEMAVVVARFLEKAQQATAGKGLRLTDRADLTGLCDEFRNELSLLGSKYQRLARDMLVTKKILGNLVAQVGIHRVMIRRLDQGQKDLEGRVGKLETTGGIVGMAASPGPLASPSEVRALLARSIDEARAGRLDPVEARTVGYLSNKLLRELKDERYLKNLVRETLREEGLLRP